MGSAEYLHLRAPSGVFFGEFSHRNEDGPAESLAAGCAEVGSGMPEPDIRAVAVVAAACTARTPARAINHRINRTPDSKSFITKVDGTR